MQVAMQVATRLSGSVSLRLGCHARERLTFRANSEDGVVTEPAPKGGMTTETKRHGLGKFEAFEVAIEIIGALKGVVMVIRQHDADLARQVVRAASSVAANVAEGNRRLGKDRLHMFRIAAGSADEVRAHLRVARAWGFIDRQAEQALGLLDRELAMLYRLTH